MPTPPISHRSERLKVMLSRISIRSKITAVLVILLVAMTGMGLFAIRQM